MKSMDAVFLFFDFSGKFIYHLGQSYIVANLRTKGYQADCFILDSYATIEEVTVAIAKLNPKIIGFSIYDYNIYLTKELAKLLKEKMSDKVVIVAGGPTATFSTEKVFEFIPEIDLCSRFAGEEVWSDLLHCILNNKDYRQLNSISYRSHEGEIINNPIESLISDLDEYPSPYLEQVIDIPRCQRVNQMVMMVTSRGCVFSCRYCNFAAIGQHSISFNSINRVIAELKFIIKSSNEQGIDAKIEFMDDIFTINRSRTIELCQRIIDEKLNIEFGCQTRADFVDAELLELLYKAGCRRISYGLESGVPKILNSMGKVNPIIDNTFEKEKSFILKVKEAVKLSVALKIDTTVNVIFGWQGETEEEALESLKILNEMNATHYAHNILTYYAGTEAYMNAIEQHKQEIELLEAQSHMALNLNYDNMPALYNYNPRILPHLQNDLIKYAMSHRRSIIQTIMGIGFMKEQIPQVLLIDNKSISFSWMINNLGTNIKVHIYDEVLPNQLTFYYPLRAYAGECFDGKEFSKLQNAETVDQRLLITGADAYCKNYNEKVCVGLKDEEDLNKYMDNLENISVTELLDKSSYNSNDYMLMDYCRWSHENECPAMGLKRIVIKNGYIYTCINGEPIMKLEDFNLLEAQIIIQKRFEEVCASRGCLTCDIQDQCPKCINVSQFGHENYCKFQHKKHMYKNFKRMNNVKLMEYFYVP